MTRNSNPNHGNNRKDKKKKLQSAQANRVFHRTRSYLWCLGDPNQPFPAPKDCPPAACIPKVAP
jgi:hypothetical protein